MAHGPAWIVLLPLLCMAFAAMQLVSLIIPMPASILGLALIFGA